MEFTWYIIISAHALASQPTDNNFFFSFFTVNDIIEASPINETEVDWLQLQSTGAKSDSKETTACKAYTFQR